ncbi:hypothetical protein [Providencia sp. PROV076]|uniref:hypothetical protein n=1 Tax=Providencia sp. PROV076 TaxID=2949798 RepID=UPI00234AB118|nr:hypothetical protein [Providencia sp. PROV076]
MQPKQIRRYREVITIFKGRAFNRDDLFIEMAMNGRSGATTRIKSLLKYGLIYQCENDLYRVSDNSEQILDQLKTDINTPLNDDEFLLALVKRFDALLAGVRA